MPSGHMHGAMEEGLHVPGWDLSPSPAAASSWPGSSIELQLPVTEAVVRASEAGQGGNMSYEQEHGHAPRETGRASRG